jgi:hypothetical protein
MVLMKVSQFVYGKDALNYAHIGASRIHYFPSCPPSQIFYEFEGICKLDKTGFDELFEFAHLLELEDNQKNRLQIKFCGVQIKILT